MHNRTDMRKDFITPATRNLSELFSSERSYIIPGYQRPYEWDKEKVQRLFESITDAASSTSGIPLLIGTIQLNRTDNKYEIIDGQQRLTTLWLLFQALDIAEGLFFSPSNEINRQYSDDFDKAHLAKDDGRYKPGNRYEENYLLLCRLAEKLDECSLTKEALTDFLLNSVITVEIVTDLGNKQSIETIIRIFDALNTSGLPLDRKDVFKIRFRDYLVNHPENRPEDILPAINEAYGYIEKTRELGDAYALEENDLIQAFRFYLLSFKEEDISANDMNKSSSEFFEQLFARSNQVVADKDSSAKPDRMAERITKEHFVRLARTVFAVQERIKYMDKEDYSGRQRQLCARELLKRSFYSSLCPILYTLVYLRIPEEEFECIIENHDESRNYVLDALQITELLWQYCSSVASVALRARYEVFSTVGRIALKSGCSDVFSIKDMLSEAICKSGLYPSISTTMPALFGEEGNCFDARCRDLFVALSYIDDCEGNTSSLDIKNLIFYKKKDRPQVEHIVSRKFENATPCINSIGNLMFLEQKINSALGGETSANDATDPLVDFQRKCEHREDGRNYHDSNLVCVKKLLEEPVINLNKNEQLDAFIRKRGKEKRDYLQKVYSGRYGILDPSLFIGSVPQQN